jgi:ATP-dependent helicase/nuclease subunit A
VIAAEHLDRIRAEEIRILYTALTRARECLVLTAAGRADAVSALGRLDRGGPLPDDVLRSARCAADWLIAAAAGGGPGMPTVRILRADEPIDAGPTPAAAAAAASVERAEPAPPAAVDAAEADRTGPEPTEPPDLPEPIETLVRRLEWTWPVGGLAGVAAHRSVTELRQAAAPQPDSADDAAPVRPRFVQAGPQPPAANEIGTAVHAVLEHVDFTGPADEPALRALIERLIAQGRIAPALGAAVPVSAIAQFLSGPTGRFLRGHAAAVRREVPVTFAVPAGELDPKLSDPDGRETVLVRGVIDALVDCGGGFRLIDYKTDAVDAGGLAAKVDEYRRQLELYRRAVEAIWGKPVTRATLCFLSAGRDVDLWNDDGVVGAPR